MKALLLKFFVIFGVVNLRAAKEAEWISFRVGHYKLTLNNKEELYRKKILEKNLRGIIDHNERYSKGKESFTLKLNKFGYLDADELNRAKLRMDPNDFRPKGQRPERAQSPALLTTAPIPETVNWVEKGAVTSVDNQMPWCGSCWAFSAIGSVEGQYFLKTGKLIKFSKQQLVDCTKNMGCGGGDSELTFEYLVNCNGIETEKDYPYEAKDGRCRFNVSRVVVKVRSYNYLEENESNIKRLLSKIGPLYTGIDSSGENFHFYSEGVYSGENCSSTHVNHAVLIVGYGTSDNGMDYWLIKNSWGSDWGQKGYLKLIRNQNHKCGVGRNVFYPILG